MPPEPTITAAKFYDGDGKYMVLTITNSGAEPAEKVVVRDPVDTALLASGDVQYQLPRSALGRARVNPDTRGYLVLALSRIEAGEAVSLLYRSISSPEAIAGWESRAPLVLTGQDAWEDAQTEADDQMDIPRARVVVPPADMVENLGGEKPDACRTVALLSGKGGTGKTLVTANLGAALAMDGLKVACVDFDIKMADLALVYGLGQAELQYNIAGYLDGECRMEDLLHPVDGVDGLWVLPGGAELAYVQRADRRKLLLLLDYLARSFDFVLLDTASGLDDDHITAVQAADYVILVTQPKLTAVEDGRRVKYIVELMGTKVKMPTHLLGIVVTRFDMPDSHYSLSEMEMEFGLPVLGAIPDDPFIDPKLGPPVVLGRAGCPAARAFIECARTINARTRTGRHTNLLNRLGRYIIPGLKRRG